MVRFICGECKGVVQEVKTSRYCGGSIPCPHCGMVNGYPVKEFRPGQDEDFVSRSVAPPAPPEGSQPASLPEITEAHAEFLRSHGYAAETVERARKFIASLSPQEQVSFFADFGAAVQDSPENEQAGRPADDGRSAPVGEPAVVQVPSDPAQ